MDNGHERNLTSFALGDHQCPSPALQQSIDLMQSHSRERQSGSRSAEPSFLSFDSNNDPFGLSLPRLTAGTERQHLQPSVMPNSRGNAGHETARSERPTSGQIPPRADAQTTNTTDVTSIKESVTKGSVKDITDSKPHGSSGEGTNGTIGNSAINSGMGGFIGTGSNWGLSTNARPQELLSTTQLAAQTEGFFNKVDKDRNGVLSSSELGRAVEDHSFTGLDAQALAAVYRNRHDLSGLSDDQLLWESDVSRQDLAAFTRLAAGDQSKLSLHDRTLLAGVNMITERTVEGQRVGSDQLYGSENRPSGFAIDQGTIGDCYFLASISSLANGNPDAIRNMIHDNNNGTYTVTFPGDRFHPITVDAPTEAEGGLYQQASSNGIWRNILETAYGEYRQRQRYFRQGNTATEGSDGGGQPSDVIKLLTGAQSIDLAVHPSAFELGQTRAALTEAFSHNRAVAASTLTSDSQATPGPERTPNGFLRQHAYSVIGWNPDGPGGGTITLRNPWGSGSEGKEGVSAVSLTEFQRNFSNLAVEGSNRGWFSFLPWT